MEHSELSKKKRQPAENVTFDLPLTQELHEVAAGLGLPVSYVRKALVAFAKNAVNSALIYDDKGQLRTTKDGVRYAVLSLVNGVAKRTAPPERTNVTGTPDPEVGI